MKVKALIAFKSKLFKPCRKLLRIFKFRFKRALSISSLRHRRHQAATERKTYRSSRNRVRSFLPTFLRKPKPLEDMDEVAELKSMTEVGRDRVLFPSPLTPAYIRSSRAGKEEASSHDNEVVEDACRSFENYLVEMIVEEGKMRDLMDVEELLYCWKHLKCPVFIELICRFYGELCKDLFSGQGEEKDFATPN